MPEPSSTAAGGGQQSYFVPVNGGGGRLEDREENVRWIKSVCADELKAGGGQRTGDGKAGGGWREVLDFEFGGQGQEGTEEDEEGEEEGNGGTSSECSSYSSSECSEGEDDAALDLPRVPRKAQAARCSRETLTDSEYEAIIGDNPHMS